MMIKKRLTIVVVFILGITLSQACTSIPEFKARGMDSGGKEILNVLVSTQKSYFEEWGEYSNDVERLMPSPANIEGYEVFFKQDDIPLKYKELFTILNVPLLQKDSYRFAVIVKNKYRKKISIWIATDKIPPYLFISSLPIDE